MTELKDEVTLKPCPNLECPKSSPTVDSDCGYDECVYCKSCGASTGWYKGYALPNGRAIASWNARPADDVVEAAKAALDWLENDDANYGPAESGLLGHIVNRLRAALAKASA